MMRRIQGGHARDMSEVVEVVKIHRVASNGKARENETLII